MRKIDPNEPAFPVPASVNPTHGTLPDGDAYIPASDGIPVLLWLAHGAPEMPDWYKLRGMPVARSRRPGNEDVVDDFQRSEEQKYFNWRLHYANMMIRAMNDDTPLVPNYKELVNACGEALTFIEEQFGNMELPVIDTLRIALANHKK